MSLIIHAPNVHQGGGKTLLAALLEAAAERVDARAILDERLTVAAPGFPAERTFRVAPTLTGRLRAEILLRRLASAEATVLCFGNLPPLLPTRGRIVVFVQNRFLLERVSLAGFSLRTRMRITLERLWLSSRSGAAHAVAVQTPSMATAARAALGVEASVWPFVRDASGYARRGAGGRGPAPRKYDFLYVGSGDPHKNHDTLIAAWELLAASGIFPSLCLTLSREHHGRVCRLVESTKARSGLRIDNVDGAGADDIARLYRESAALIYPSTLESLGLPLLEARAAGLAVLAPESDYTRDVIDPDESFDPASAVSIARAVKRFLGIPEPPLPLLNAAAFLNRVEDAPGSDETPRC